jgi:hypothetical protein
MNPRESTIQISLDTNPIFTWEGGEDSAKEILEAIPAIAASANVSPLQFSDMCLALMLKESALMSNPVEQLGQMRGIIWRILQSETGNDQHPGKISDYVGAVNFVADITPIDQGCTIRIEATSDYDA